MELNESYREYLKWEHQHKEEITKALSKEFQARYLCAVPLLLRGSDCIGLTGLVLLPIAIALIAYGISPYLVIAIFVALILYLRWFTKHVILLCLQDAFKKHEYSKILEDFVYAHWNQKYESAKSDDERSRIQEMYQICSKNIQSTVSSFEYWK